MKFKKIEATPLTEGDIEAGACGYYLAIDDLDRVEMEWELLKVLASREDIHINHLKQNAVCELAEQMVDVFLEFNSIKTKVI